MGLDQYAHWVKPNQLSEEQQVDFTFEDDSGYSYRDTEFYYWRKHWPIQEWMQKLYIEKGGTDPSFNCINLQLTMLDLQKLEQDLKNDPELFENYDANAAFIQSAMNELDQGNRIFYTSWY